MINVPALLYTSISEIPALWGGASSYRALEGVHPRKTSPLPKLHLSKNSIHWHKAEVQT